MAKHNETGALGEAIAAEYLLNKGFILLHRNWRHRRTEVDILAEYNGELVFIEVKCRRGAGYGYPEEAVDLVKQKALANAANAFIELNPRFKSVRFDIVAVTLSGEVASEIVHLPDAFY